MNKTLFRLTVMSPTSNVDRGIWADGFYYSHEGTITFFNLTEYDEKRPVGVYPVDRIFIFSIQSEEEYKKSKESSLKTITNART